MELLSFSWHYCWFDGLPGGTFPFFASFLSVAEDRSSPSSDYCEHASYSFIWSPIFVRDVFIDDDCPVGCDLFTPCLTLVAFLHIAFTPFASFQRRLISDMFRYDAKALTCATGPVSSPLPE